MGLLLGFAPLIAFSVIAGISVDLALWLALAIAFVIAIRDFAQTRLLRALDVGSTFLFGLIALYAGFIQPSLSSQAVRLIVDGGFLVLALGSIFTGNPFTLDYLRELVPDETWHAPDFVRGNFVLSSAWCLAFAAMTIADSAATFSRKFPLSLASAAGLAVLTLAVIFTARHSAHASLRTARAQKPPQGR